MIKNLLKYLVLGAALLVAPSINAQVYEKFPTNIKYIGGGFNNKNPFFKTLEAALNQVKATATSSNPYGFWLASDTLWISDWDSVFTESGLTMKDSIDIYYVAEGKIKWMPFGQGGSSGSSAIINQDDITLHYYWPNWDQGNVALPVWQRQMGSALDSIDEEVYRLIVYTQMPLYIENDTLKLDTTDLGSTSGWNPDTSTVVRTTGTQSISATNTWSGGNTFTSGISFSGLGNMQLPGSNGNVGAARIVWGNTANIYYSGGGLPADSNIVCLIDATTKHAKRDTFIVLANLASETLNKFPTSGTATFLGDSSSMEVGVTGMASTSIIILTAVYSDSGTAINANDFCVAIPLAGKFYIKRGLSGTTNLKVNWAWIKD